MGDDEFDKVLVILLPNTLSDPYTVMVKATNTHIAHSAMFASCWFDDVARFAMILFQIHHIVIVLLVLIDILFVVLLIYYSWFVSTCLKEGVETKECHC